MDEPWKQKWRSEMGWLLMIRRVSALTLVVTFKERTVGGILVILLALLIPASPALAQEGVSKAATAFVAPGVIVASETATIHFGGGGEFIWPNGVGVGVDLGYFTDAERLDDPEEGLGMFSVGLIYEGEPFAENDSFRPYVRGGLSGVFSNLGGFGLMHLGGGVNQWFGERWGLKFDVRDHFFYSFHILEFSVGVLIR